MIEFRAGYRSGLPKTELWISQLNSFITRSTTKDDPKHSKRTALNHVTWDRLWRPFRKVLSKNSHDHLQVFLRHWPLHSVQLGRDVCLYVCQLRFQYQSEVNLEGQGVKDTAQDGKRLLFNRQLSSENRKQYKNLKHSIFGCHTMYITVTVCWRRDILMSSVSL